MTRPVQLFRGDCLDLLPSIPDGSVDMICADLPYGTTNCHWDNRIPMEPLWREFWRVAKHNAAVCLFAQQPFATDLINAARKWFRYEWVVVKNRALGFLNANKMPLRAHELVLVFYRALPPYTPQTTGEGKPCVIVRKANPPQIYGSTHGTTTWSDGRRFPRDVLMARAINKPTHPTEKSVEVLEILIKSYTNRGGGGGQLRTCAGSDDGKRHVRRGVRTYGAEVHRNGKGRTLLRGSTKTDCGSES